MPGSPATSAKASKNSGIRPAQMLGTGCPSADNAFTLSSASSLSARPGGLSPFGNGGEPHEPLEVALELG
eukprot:8130003-Alexandrium_andersonii.AAC.1